LILKGNSILEKTWPQTYPKSFLKVIRIYPMKKKKALQTGLSVHLQLDKSSYRRR